MTTLLRPDRSVVVERLKCDEQASNREQLAWKAVHRTFSGSQESEILAVHVVIFRAMDERPGPLASPVARSGKSAPGDYVLLLWELAAIVAPTGVSCHLMKVALGTLAA
jgi:hypothetical protein